MYQKLSKRTCKDLGSDKLDLSHMQLGIISEIPELLIALRKKDIVNLGEELGDICWYLSNYCTFRNISFSDVKITKRVHKPNVNFMVKKVLIYTDVVKKNIAYNKSIDIKVEKQYLEYMVSFVVNMCDFYGLDFENVLNKNIEKLSVRYPDIYTDFLAINRDLEKELNILK